MVDALQIMESINKVVVKGIPEYEIPAVDIIEAVYIDIVPKKFHRPSLLIEYVQTGENAVSCAALRCVEYFTLTIYDSNDDYSNTSTMRLLDLQRKVMNLFRPGYLRVDDRAIAVKASTGGREWDKAYIDLQFEFHDLRTEVVDNTPMIETIETTVNIKE